MFTKLTEQTQEDVDDIDIQHCTNFVNRNIIGNQHLFRDTIEAEKIKKQIEKEKEQKKNEKFGRRPSRVSLMPNSFQK